MSHYEITFGNREGQYFTEWRFELLAELLHEFHFGPMPPWSMVMEVLNPEIWYDAYHDYHCLKFTSHGKVVEVELYKVFSCKIDGVEGWVGCPRNLINDFSNFLRRKVVNYEMGLAFAEANTGSNQFYALYAVQAKRLAEQFNVDAPTLFRKLNDREWPIATEYLDKIDAEGVNKIMAGKG